MIANTHIYSSALCEHLQVNRYKFAENDVLDFDQLEAEIMAFADRFEEIAKEFAKRSVEKKG